VPRAPHTPAPQSGQAELNRDNKKTFTSIWHDFLADSITAVRPPSLEQGSVGLVSSLGSARVKKTVNQGVSYPMKKDKSWQRPQWVAILTGVISVGMALAYLLLVQLLDFRGTFLPAPSEGFLF